MNKLKKWAVFFFGAQTKTRYKRLMIFIIVIVVSIILVQNVGCEYKNGKFSFEWAPAAAITIEK